MHPMFVKLFLEPDADDPLADEKKRHPAILARRHPPRTVRRAAVRTQGRRMRRGA